MNNGYGKYKKTAIESANKEKILLMLYEGAMKFIKQAMEAVDNKDIAKRGEYIGRAYDIIMELMSSLNHEIGGEMAKNLEQLYIYSLEELTRANLTGDKKNLENCLKVLNILYDGWSKAIETVKKKESQSA
ncbi:MAG: flagellar export chaperone FliS [Bdellovibrionaceae bacterium]|nr:flagellar export chaperone FliS [Pseudobdellovibrionaceae bacterium]